MGGKLQSGSVHITKAILLIVASSEEKKCATNSNALRSTANLGRNAARQGAAPNHVINVKGHHIVETPSRLSTRKSASSKKLETVTNEKGCVTTTGPRGLVNARDFVGGVTPKTGLNTINPKISQGLLSR